MMPSRIQRGAFLAIAVAANFSCAGRHVANPVPKPRITPHAAWETERPLGHVADATRRNKRAGDSLAFRGFTISVLETLVDSTTPKPTDVVRLRLALGASTETRAVREGAAFNWNGFHIAVVAVYGPGELGAGLAAIEVATVASLPPHVAASEVAGGADYATSHRAQHHARHAAPHRRRDAAAARRGPVRRLRNLQSWGARDRNWWDLPYHFLLGLDGSIFEGRDYRFMGETNTAYDPGGHFLISVARQLRAPGADAGAR